MVNTFGILSAIVLAFSAFVAFKNKEEFGKQDIATKAEAGRLETNTKTYNGLVASIKQKEADTSDSNKSRDDYRAKVEAQTEKNSTVQAEIDAKQKELDATRKEVADAEEELKELGNLEDLAPKLERLQASIVEYKDKVAILNAQIDRLRGEKSRTGEALAAAKKRQSQITSGQSFPTMKTKIRSIDRRLGIVTLAAGMRSGVIGGSKVAVMRGGEKIAELNVKAVSANLATADVIQSSLKEGENVAPGDVVVPAESATDQN